MSDQTMQTSRIEDLEIDSLVLKHDRLVHLLLTAWTMILEQEPASGPQLDGSHAGIPPIPPLA